MLNTIRMAGLAVAVALGALTSVSAPASAQDGFDIIIERDGARMRSGDYCERNPWNDRCRDYRRGDGDRGRYEERSRRGRNWSDDGPRRGPDRRFVRGCSADEALGKARRMGIRRAQVVGMSERSIRVAGRADGRSVMVRFGRAGNCPVL